MILGFAALVMIAGLLMYGLATNGKVTEIGRIMFFAGLFALLLNGERVVALLK